MKVRQITDEYHSFIRVPGIEGGVNHTYGGQIDILPTLLHLLGMDSKDYVQFGTDLLSEQHDRTCSIPKW